MHQLFPAFGHTNGDSNSKHTLPTLIDFEDIKHEMEYRCLRLELVANQYDKIYSKYLELRRTKEKRSVSCQKPDENRHVVDSWIKIYEIELHKIINDYYQCLNFRGDRLGSNTDDTVGKKQQDSKNCCKQQPHFEDATQTIFGTDGTTSESDATDQEGPTTIAAIVQPSQTAIATILPPVKGPGPNDSKIRDDEKTDTKQLQDGNSNNSDILVTSPKIDDYYKFVISYNYHAKDDCKHDGGAAFAETKIKELRGCREILIVGFDWFNKLYNFYILFDNRVRQESSQDCQRYMVEGFGIPVSYMGDIRNYDSMFGDKFDENSPHQMMFYLKLKQLQRESPSKVNRLVKDAYNTAYWFNFKQKMQESKEESCPFDEPISNAIQPNRDTMEIINQMKNNDDIKDTWDKILIAFNSFNSNIINDNKNGRWCRLIENYKLIFTNDSINSCEKPQQEWLTKATHVFENDCIEKTMLYYSIDVTIYCLAVQFLAVTNHEMVFWDELIKLLLQCGIFNIKFMREWLHEQNLGSFGCLQDKLQDKFKQILQVVDTHSSWFGFIEPKLKKDEKEDEDENENENDGCSLCGDITMLNYGLIHQNLRKNHHQQVKKVI